MSAPSFAADPSTSLQRTYRYLRLSVAGTVVVIFVAVGAAAASVGWLTSISDYYYTSARDPFVGALVAVSLGLLALSGRGPERGLLDAVALFAPLVAVVPTTLVPGAVFGVEVPCEFRCFPPEYETNVGNGVITYVAVGGLAVLVTLLLIALRQVSLRGVWLSLAVTVAVLAVTALTWAFARDIFLQQAHFVATIAFFALFAAVVVRNAFPRRGEPPSPAFRLTYVVIAVLLGLVLVAYVALAVSGIGVLADVPVVLIIEASALVLFGAFWVVQCIEKWDQTDPSLR